MASRRLCEAASSALWLRGMQRKAREKTVRNRTAPWQPAMAQCDLAIQTLEIWRFFTKHPRLFLGHSFPSRNKTDGEGHLGDLLYPSVILQWGNILFQADGFHNHPWHDNCFNKRCNRISCLDLPAFQFSSSTTGLRNPIKVLFLIYFSCKCNLYNQYGNSLRSGPMVMRFHLHECTNASS